MSLRAAALDDPLALRRADADLLSLALIDARNLTLRWLAVFEHRGLDGEPTDGRPSPRWLAGHAPAPHHTPATIPQHRRRTEEPALPPGVLPRSR